MKFEIDQIVRVKSSGNTAKIKSYKFEKYYHSGKIVESYRYYVVVNNNQFVWYDESNLEVIEYKFKPKFEKQFLDLLIDINLSNGNYEMVKVFNEQKQELKEVK